MTPSVQTTSRRCYKALLEKAVPWHQGLPDEWRAAAIAPLEFMHHREYELPAHKTVGFDEAHAACYYHHVYVLGSLCSDDDEDFYEAVVYGEEVEAWRLRDERWLVWRVVHEDGACAGNRGFYSFSEEMPK